MASFLVTTFKSIRASDSFSTSLWEIVSDSTVSVEFLLKLDWLHMEISMNEVFLYGVYMHVLYNDFLIILIIGMNLASHHK